MTNIAGIRQFFGALVVGAAKGETIFNYVEMAREMAHD
jgi:hypothetical protein